MIRDGGPAKVFAGLVFLTFQVFAILGCQRDQKEYLARPVAIVNDREISYEQFAKQLAKKMRHYDAISAKNETVLRNSKEEIIREFVIQVITRQWADQQNVHVTEREIDQEVDRIRANYPDDLSFRRTLTSENISVAAWREELSFTLLQRKVAEALRAKIQNPTDSELQDYYKNHKSEFFVKEQALLKQIVLDKEENSELVLKQLKLGAKFDVLAKRYSISPDAKNGGDLGWIEKGTLEVFDAAFSLSPGSRSPVIKSPYGFHILSLVKKAPAHQLSFEQAKDRIRLILLRQREQVNFQKWLEAEVRKAKVKRNDSGMDSIILETRSDH